MSRRHLKRMGRTLKWRQHGVGKAPSVGFMSRSCPNASHRLCAATAIYYGETIHQQSSSFTPAVDPLQDACNPAAANLHHSPYTAIFVLAWFLVTLSFQLCCPMEYEPVGWHIKWWLMPWLPSTAIGLIIFR